MKAPPPSQPGYTQKVKSLTTFNYQVKAKPQQEQADIARVTDELRCRCV